MKRIILSACLLLLGTSVAAAGALNESGAYIGATVGVTKLDDDGAFNDFKFDDSDMAFGIYGGYKFFKYFAVEARLLNLGTYTVEFIDIDTKAYTVNAVGIIPFGASGWELFGGLGVGQINLDAGGIDDTNETITSLGIGVRFTPIENLSIALATDGYGWEDDNFDIVVVATQFAIQYNF